MAVREDDRFTVCDPHDASQVPRGVFQVPKATHFVVVDFKPSCEQAHDVTLGRLVANSVHDLLRDHLIDIAAGDLAEDGAARREFKKAVEVYRLKCVVRSHTEAEEVGEAMGADLVLWGDAYCPMRTETGAPLVSIENNVHQELRAEGNGQISTKDVRVEVNGPKPEALAKLQEVRAGSFCVHAALTANGWPVLRSKTETALSETLLRSGNIELPQVVGGDAYGLVLFVGGLHFYQREDYANALRLFRRASESLRTDSRSAPELVQAIGLTELHTGKYVLAADYLKRCESLAKDRNDTWWQCRFARIQATEFMGELVAARNLTDDGLRRARATNRKREEALAVALLGDMALRQSQLAQAKANYEEALLLCRAIGYRQGEVNALRSLGDLELTWSQLEKAKLRYEEVLPLYRAIGDRQGEANTLQGLGDVAFRQSQLEQSKARYEEALSLYRAIGARLGEANMLVGLGNLALRQDQLEQAKARYDEALSLHRALGNRLGEANTLRGLGDLALSQDELGQAKARYEEALPLYRAVGGPLGVANTLVSLGNLASKQGQGNEAESLYLTAREMYVNFDDRYNRARVDALRAVNLLQGGNGSTARELLDQAHRTFIEIQDPHAAAAVESILKRLGPEAASQSPP